MKILAFGDVHITEHTEFSVDTEDGLTSHLHACLASADWLEKVILEQKPDLVVNLGDIVENKGVFSERVLWTVDRFTSILTAVCQRTKSQYVQLLGNHDYKAATFRDRALAMIDNKILYTDPTVIIPFVGKPYSVLLLPFNKEMEETACREIVRATEAEQGGNLKLCLGHIPVHGARMTPKSDYLEKGGLDPQVFEGIPLINGHYHFPGEYGKVRGDRTETSVIFAGCLVAKDFKDLQGDIPHGAVLFDMDNWSWTRLANPHTPIFMDTTVDDALLIEEMGRACVRLYFKPEEDEAADSIKPLFLGCRKVPIVGAVDVTEVELVDDSAVIQAYVKENASEGIQESALNTLESVLEGIDAEDVGFAQRDIVIKRVHLHNFASYADTTFTPEIGTTLVLGDNEDEKEGNTGDSNGAGKSSLFEGILWCWFGDSPKGKAQEVIRDGTRDCHVLVEASVNGTEYVFGRYRNHPEYKTSTRILLVNEDPSCEAQNIAPESISGADEEIIRIIGMDLATFCQVVFLRDDLTNKFMDLSFADRTRLLETVFNLGRYDLAQGQVKKIYDSLQLTVRTTEETIRSTEDWLQSTKEGLIELEADTGDAVDVPGIQARIAALNKEIADSQVEIDKIRAMKDKTTALVTKTREHLDGYIQAEREEENARTKAVTVISHKKNELTKIEDLIKAGNCPTCGSPCTQEKFGDGVNILNGDVRDWMEEKSQRDKALYDIRLKKQVFVDKIRAAEEKGRSLSQDEDQIRRAVTVRTSEISQATSILAAAEAREGQREKQRKKLQETEKKLSNTLTDAKAKLEEATYAASIHGWLVKALSTDGIRNKILESRIGLMNKWLKDHTQRIWSSGKVEILHVRGSKIGVKVGGRKYEHHSRGERKRTDILLQTLLNYLYRSSRGLSVNLVLYDEVFDGLDDGGLRVVTSMIDEVTAGLSVYITSHNSSLKNMVPRSITAVKSGGVTTLVQ